ncbi:MAG: MFS transporter, partial [Bacillota bacterium]
MKLNWKYTFVIGLGFFGVGLIWPIYNAYMPIFYAKFIESKTTIGYLMTIDNWLALTLTPLIGFLSDRTRTRFGRRIPYLLIFAPLSALFMALIPLGWASSLVILFAAAVLMNLSMAAWRSPIVALMPDVTPQELRSKANGIINFMGGLAYIAATGGGAILYKMYPGYPFFGAALLLLGVTLAFRFWIREPENASEKSERFQLGRVNANAFFLLLAIFFWFVGYNSLETWVTTYGKEHLMMHEADVAGLLVFSGGAFLLFAIPAGFLADGFGRWKGLGRKRTIMGGLVLMILAFFLLDLQTNLKAGWHWFLLVGFAWSWININSYP